MAKKSIYRTITGGQIPLSDLSEAEYEFLDIVADNYSARKDWTRFAAWWNARFNVSGLPTSSVVYRICQDMEARLGIKHGKCASGKELDAKIRDYAFRKLLAACKEALPVLESAVNATATAALAGHKTLRALRDAIALGEEA